jgi:hypothetical protein
MCSDIHVLLMAWKMKFVVVYVTKCRAFVKHFVVLDCVSVVFWF